jgi:hypothetical protein
VLIRAVRVSTTGEQRNGKMQRNAVRQIHHIVNCHPTIDAARVHIGARSKKKHRALAIDRINSPVQRRPSFVVRAVDIGARVDKQTQCIGLMQTCSDVSARTERVARLQINAGHLDEHAEHGSIARDNGQVQRCGIIVVAQLTHHDVAIEQCLDGSSARRSKPA